MKNNILILSFFLFSIVLASGQTKYAVRNNIFVFPEPNDQLQPVGVINIGDSVKTFENTDIKLESREDPDWFLPEQTTWAKIKMFDGTGGWVSSFPFVDLIYPKPLKLKINSGPGDIYLFGWDTTGNYIAYAFAGNVYKDTNGASAAFELYALDIDMAVYHIHGPQNKENPVSGLWDNNYMDIQRSLDSRNIIPLKVSPVINPMPVKDQNGNPIKLSFEMKKDYVDVFAQDKSEKIELQRIYTGEVNAVKTLGWIINPYNKMVIVFCSLSTDKYHNIIHVFAFDRKRL